jgi:signal transduction histidine kinase
MEPPDTVLRGIDVARLDHDLRGPLNAILGFGRLLETEELTPDQRECVEQILLGGERLRALIEATLGTT